MRGVAIKNAVLSDFYDLGTCSGVAMVRQAWKHKNSVGMPYDVSETRGNGETQGNARKRQGNVPKKRGNVSKIVARVGPSQNPYQNMQLGRATYKFPWDWLELRIFRNLAG
ncbi:hypothetical protein Tco_0903846, partial [Tanacetum coccineum]